MSQTRLGDVLVLGLGRTGEAVARYLISLGGDRVESVTLFGGAQTTMGERARDLVDAGVSVVVGTEDVQGTYDLSVVSPGIPCDSAFFRAAEVAAQETIGEPEFAFRESPKRWVAITGTNGKTTTTSLVTHLLCQGGLSAVSVGNIGRVITDELTARSPDEWFVAELSSFQLATTRLLHPKVAVLLNITPDHVEWHGSMQAYAKAKERIFANLDGHDLAIISTDDDLCRDIASRAKARGLRVLELSVEREPEAPSAAFLREGRLVVRLDGCETGLVATDDLQIFGAHNAQNALAAAAAALEVGVSADDVCAGLTSFVPIEHRIEPCGVVGGVHFVNDSKATNTDAVEKALAAFDAGTIVLLLGGHDKGTDLTSLASAVCARARVAVTYGEAGGRIADALKDARAATESSLDIVCAPHLREAFAAAVAAALPGETVLLSPACSSFDEFSGMGERGRLFKQLVCDLGAQDNLLGGGE